MITDYGYWQCINGQKENLTGYNAKLIAHTQMPVETSFFGLGLLEVASFILILHVYLVGICVYKLWTTQGHPAIH